MKNKLNIDKLPRRENSLHNVKAHAALTEGGELCELAAEIPAAPETSAGQGLCGAACSTVLFGSEDRCWNCSKGWCLDGHLECDHEWLDNYCVFEWQCNECGYIQKSRYKINLRYSVAGTPWSRHWKGGEIPQHTSIERRIGVPSVSDSTQSSEDIQNTPLNVQP